MSSISPSPTSIPILPSPSNSTHNPIPPSPSTTSPPTNSTTTSPPNLAPPPTSSDFPMPPVTSNTTQNPPPPPNVPDISPPISNAPTPQVPWTPPPANTTSPPPPTPLLSPPPPNVAHPSPSNSPPPPQVTPPDNSLPPPPPEVSPPQAMPPDNSPPSPPPPPQAMPPENSPPSPPQPMPPENSPPSKMPSPPPPPQAMPPENSPPSPSQAMPPENSPPPPPSPPQEMPPENSPPSKMPSPPLPPQAVPPENSLPPPPSASPPVPPGPLPPSPPAPSQSPSPPGNEPGAIPPSPLTSTPLAPSPPSNSSGGGSPSNPSPVPTILTPAGPEPSPSNSGSGDGGGIGIGGSIAIGVGAALILLSLIGLAIWCLRKQKRKGARQNGVYVVRSYGPSESPDLLHLKTQSPVPFLGSDSSGVNSPALGSSRSSFTYQELEEITDGFSSENLLGEGGFGVVYKGCLADGREVAVKQLKIGGGQGEREFRAEVDIISRIHHRHLVSLVGYCISDNQRMLVYDYVPNNNLHYHLHSKDRPVMDWRTRSRVAAGAARGIAYLHEDCHPRIIHRDIKSSNILLDNNFEAQVSDFGLAKLASDGNSHVSTRVVGTFGYMAPEYARSGKLTEKSDVFSFGVVLLELITGRKPVDTSQPLGDESLVEWARPLLSHALDKEEFEELVDPRLENNFDKTEMFQMIEAAATCVRYSAEKRPRMGQVMRALDSLGYSNGLNNGMALGKSQVFNTTENQSIIQRMAFGSQNYSTDFFSQDG